MIKNPTYYYPLLISTIRRILYYEDDRYAILFNWLNCIQGKDGVMSNRNDLMLNFHVMVF